ncbi:SMI1/KNR4 family protein [Streptomyces sp. NPDC090077]|uniref:SMI1/KNR4 family protein n=1 Tax=Streptomyces sp. NPDC090077 TaxID=3365938 RepID=UPI00382072D1
MPNSDEVTLSWTRIVHWLEDHAPASAEALNPPAADADILRLNDSLGFPVPEPLEAWLRLNNGSTARDSKTPISGGYQLNQHRDSLIFPGGAAFLDCRRIIENHQQFLAIAHDIDDEDWWKPTWIPVVAYFDGHNGLALESETHDATLPVLSYSESDYAKTYASSLGEVLTAMANTLEHNTPGNALTRGYQASIQDGRVFWR